MLRLKDLAQEKRQTSVQEKPTEVEVTMTREDFPLQKAQIKISYYLSSPQEAWEKFLSDVTRALKLDFIYSILERGDKAPIYRIIMLKHGGEYLVRQRENSAVLEVLNDGIQPMEISWEVTRDIIHVKKDLEFNLRTNPITQDRVFKLVTKPITSLRQKEFVDRLLQNTKPKDIVDDINKLYLPGVETWSPEYTAGLMSLDYKKIQRLEAYYDMVTIHRLSLEQLNRLCSQGFEAIVAKQAIHYVFKVMKDMVDECDIVAIALKLTADLARFLLKERDGIFTAVLNAMQYYALPAPTHRPRKPKRLAMSMDIHSNGHTPAPATAVAYDLAGMYVDPSAYESKPASQQGQRKTATIGANNTDKVCDDVVEAIFAKRSAKLQQTKMKLLNKPPADLFQLSRYGEYYANDNERSHLRGITQKALGFSQRIEFDESSLRPITPKMRKVMEDEEKQRIKMQKEEEEQRKQREKLQRELEAAERNRPKVILQQRDRVDVNQARAAIRSAQEADSSVSIQLPPVTTASPTMLMHSKHIHTNTAGSNNSANNTNTRSRTVSHATSVTPIPDDGEEEDDEENEDDEEEGSEDDSENRGKALAALPNINSSSKRPPAPMKKVPSSLLPAATSASADIPSTSTFNNNTNNHADNMKPKKKKVAIIIHKRVADNNGSVDTKQTSSSETKGWSGSKGVVGKRFDPDSAPAATKPTPGSTTSAAAGEGVSFKLGAAIPEDTKTDDVEKEEDEEDDEEEDGKGEEESKHSNKDNIDKLPIVPASPAMSQSGSVVSLSHPPQQIQQQQLQPRRNSDAKSIASQSVTSHSINNNNYTNNDSNNNNYTNNDSNNNATSTGEDVGVRSWVPSYATLIKRAKKVKFVKQPLPPAPRATFRAFENQMPVNLILTASLAALLQLLLVNYGNREWAFTHSVLAEVAEVVSDCAAMPKLLEYFVDIVEILYREGLGDATDHTQANDMDNADMVDQQLDTASFLSAMVSDTGVGAESSTQLTVDEESKQSIGDKAHSNYERNDNDKRDNEEDDESDIDDDTLTEGIQSRNKTNKKGKRKKQGKNMAGHVLDTASELTLPNIDSEVVWSQIHDKEAAKLAELGSMHGTNSADLHNASQGRTKIQAASLAALRERQEGSDSDHNSDSDAEGDGEGKKKENKKKEEEKDAIVIQKITDKDSFRSLAALDGEEGENEGPRVPGQPLEFISYNSNGRKQSVASSGNNSHNNTATANGRMSFVTQVSSAGVSTTAGSATSPTNRSSRPSMRASMRSKDSKSQNLASSKAAPAAEESGYRLYVRSTLRDRLARNKALVQSLGLSDFDARYRQTPEDSVILALSITMHHVEVSPRTRELAEFWLEFWADGSRDYKILIIKGRNLCGL